MNLTLLAQATTEAATQAKPFFSANSGEASLTGFTANQTGTLAILMGVIGWLFTNREMILGMLSKILPWFKSSTAVTYKSILDNLPALWDLMGDEEFIAAINKLFTDYKIYVEDKKLGFWDIIALIKQCCIAIEAGRPATEAIVEKAPAAPKV